jgi:hypothetical protein
MSSLSSKIQSSGTGNRPSTLINYNHARIKRQAGTADHVGKERRYIPGNDRLKQQD